MNISKSMKQILMSTLLIASCMTIFAYPEIPKGQNILPEADEVKINALWTSRIESYQREGENRLGDLKRLKDGSYIGIYNSGAEEFVQEGRITHISAEGDSLWDVSIQPSFFSSAERLTVTPEGRAYVIGTTMVNNLIKPYLASVGINGAIEFVSIIDTKLQNITAVSVNMSGKDVVVTYCGKENATSNTTIVLEKFNAVGQSIGSFRRVTEQSVAPLRTYCLEKFLMVPFLGNEAIAFNLEAMSEELGLKLAEGNFHNGCVSGNALYNLIQDKAGIASVTQYQIVDGKLKQVWSLTTGQNWKSYNMSVFPLKDGNIVLYVNRFNDLPGMTVIGKNGEIIQEKTSISFDSAKNCFVQSVGQSESGDYYMLGQLSSSFQIQIMKADNTLTNITTEPLSNINDDYVYFYLNSGQQYFDDGRFMIAGSMRPSSYQSGYTSFFTEINVGKSLAPQWTYTCSVGHISDVTPHQPVADKDGNCYLYYRSYYNICLAKYDNTGNFCWNITLPDNISYVFSPIIMKNGNIIFGGAGYENNLTLKCVTPSGDEVFTKNGETDGLSEIMTIMSALDKDGNLIVGFAGRDDSYASKLLIAKYNSEGVCLSKNTLDSGTQGIILTGISLTPESGVVLYGQGFDDNWVAYPCVISFDSEFGLRFVTLSNSKELQNMRYKDGIVEGGRIYLIGNTSSKGFVDVYASDGKIENHILYGEDSGSTIIDGIVGNDDGGVIMVGEILGDREVFEGFILSMDSKGEITEKKRIVEEGNGIYLMKVFSTDKGLLIAGTRYIQNVGFQTLSLLLSENFEILSESVDPVDGEYLNYTFNGASFTNGRLFVSCSEGIGISLNGFVSCSEISSSSIPSNIQTLPYSEDTGVTDYYNLQGVRVSNPASGIYLRSSNGKVEKVLIR